MFFEIWVLWGDAGFFALFASGCLGWLLFGWILGPAGTILVSPGLHFEVFVSLLGEPGGPGATPKEKLGEI